MYDPAHARSRTVQPMGGNLKPDLTLKTCLIYSLILYTVNNNHLYNTYNVIHKYGTRYNYNLHLQILSLSQFNKGAYISEIKVFNHHPEYVKNVYNDRKCFTATLTRFL